MKIVNAILTLLFVTFAIVQLNDPDPLKWVLYYGAIGVLSGAAFFNKYSRPALLLIILVTLIGLAFLIPGILDWFGRGMPSLTESMKAEKPYIEIAREFFGLFIGGITLGFHYMQMKKRA